MTGWGACGNYLRAEDSPASHGESPSRRPGLLGRGTGYQGRFRRGLGHQAFIYEFPQGDAEKLVICLMFFQCTDPSRYSSLPPRAPACAEVVVLEK